MTKGVCAETGMSPHFKDRAGQRNGRLVFVECVGQTIHKHKIWKALCDCGKTTETTMPTRTRSCGCLRSDTAAETQRSKRRYSDEERVARRKESARRQKEMAKLNPVKVMQARLSRLHRHALSRVGAIKKSPTFDMLGYSPAELATHIEKQFLPGMSWENMRDWQIDHIIPASLAVTESDVAALNQLSNLRPMWSKENNAKRDKVESLL